MSIKAVLFDLDGTLLPMDQDEFVNTYFGFLAKKMAGAGYEPEELISAVWSGTKAMILNNGQKTNESVFWDKFCSVMGDDKRADIPLFESFYEVEFQQAQAACHKNDKAADTVNALKKMGYKLVLATNPVFPKIATKSRISWAGLKEDDFEFYTTYENSCFSKPNLMYYSDILSKLSLRAEQCLMVGNDVGDDMVAKKLGMNVFLLTDCLINKDNEDISQYPNGSFDELLEYVKTL